MHSDWHRYPSADLTDIEEKVAQYCGLQANNIVLGAGSASIITTLLNYLAINGKNWWLPTPVIPCLNTTAIPIKFLFYTVAAQSEFRIWFE